MDTADAASSTPGLAQMASFMTHNAAHLTVLRSTSPTACIADVSGQAGAGQKAFGDLCLLGGDCTAAG